MMSNADASKAAAGKARALAAAGFARGPDTASLTEPALAPARACRTSWRRRRSSSRRARSSARRRSARRRRRASRPGPRPAATRASSSARAASRAPARSTYKLLKTM